MKEPYFDPRDRDACGTVTCIRDHRCCRRKCLRRQTKQPADNGCQRVAVCGAEGDRTLNLLDANQALSQLSYGPVKEEASGRTKTSPLDLVPTGQSQEIAKNPLL